MKARSLLERYRCVRLHAASCRSRREQPLAVGGGIESGDLKSLHTLITDEVNTMHYLSNAQTFRKCFHEQQKHFLYTA